MLVKSFWYFEMLFYVSNIRSVYSLEPTLYLSKICFDYSFTQRIILAELPGLKAKWSDQDLHAQSRTFNSVLPLCLSIWKVTQDSRSDHQYLLMDSYSFFSKSLFSAQYDHAPKDKSSLSLPKYTTQGILTQMTSLTISFSR